MQNLIGVQGRRELAIEGRASRDTFGTGRITTVGRTETARGGVKLSMGYFLSEYIWANIMLVIAYFFNSTSIKTGIQPLSRQFGSVFKRSIDILGSFVGLVLTSPFFVIVPILIKLDSPGPVFYRQARVGYNRRRAGRRTEGNSSLGRTVRDRRRQDLRGHPFSVIKFRTMVADAEKKCGPVWATKNDPRITRIGHLLRKTRIDEIPQFLNVLWGQMSLVGPRPERPMFVEELVGQVENYDKRLEVKPGLTGLAQIENGYDSSVASVVRKVHYDLQYIQNWSPWQDIKIILRTVLVVVTGRGAF